MKSHRKIIHIFVLLAAVAAVLPAPALASSLLSGYGGPGQGNQAVLGSALINGPRHGGGSGGSGSSAAEQGTTAQTSTTSETPASDQQGSGSENETGSAVPAGKGDNGGSGGSGGSGASTNSGNHSRAPGKRQRAAGQAATAGQATFYPAAERVPAGAQGATIPASDILYVILGAAILVSLGLLTRRAGDVTRREDSGS